MQSHRNGSLVRKHGDPPPQTNCSWISRSSSPWPGSNSSRCRTDGSEQDEPVLHDSLDDEILLRDDEFAVLDRTLAGRGRTAGSNHACTG